MPDYTERGRAACKAHAEPAALRAHAQCGKAGRAAGRAQWRKRGKAALAALLHDIAKELPKDRMLQLIAENDIIAEGAAKHLPPVWHGAAAAVLAKTEYGVEDEEILSAIRCHTTGKPHMSKLDKVLYLADMASYERTYPEAATLRQHALQNLDKTMVEALGMSISWLKETGKPVDELSLQAYAQLRAELYGGYASGTTPNSEAGPKAD